MKTTFEVVKHKILQAVQTGQWKPGDRLPALPELAKSLGASSWATERALQMLIDDGVLCRRPKKGTYVAAHEPDGEEDDRPIAVVGANLQYLGQTGYLGTVMAAFVGEFGERDWLFMPYHSLDRATARLRLLGITRLVAMTPAMQHIPLLEALTDNGIQVLCLGAGVASPKLHGVSVDNMQGVQAGLRYLAQLGHRRVAFVGTSPQTFDTQDRLEGFRRAVQEVGCDASAELVVCRDDVSARAMIEEALTAWSSLPQPPTAIFTGGEGLTWHLLEALAARQLTCPDDLSIVGFDDSPMFDHLAVPVTAVRQPLAEMGKRAAHLLSLMHHPVKTTTKLVIAPELIVRSSCARPQKDDMV